VVLVPEEIAPETAPVRRAKTLLLAGIVASLLLLVGSGIWLFFNFGPMCFRYACATVTVDKYGDVMLLPDGWADRVGGIVPHSWMPFSGQFSPTGNVVSGINTKRHRFRTSAIPSLYAHACRHLAAQSTAPLTTFSWTNDEGFDGVSTIWQGG
jgi:hypothetical protein